MQNKLILALCFGITLFWVSLFLSYQSLPNMYSDAPDIANSAAIGGFPFKVFNYPIPSLGGDWPKNNEADWLKFFINFLFWSLLSFIATSFLDQKNKLQRPKILGWFVVVAFIVSLAGLIYIRLLFD